MKLSQEDIVTRILSDSEILKVNYEDDVLNSKMYASNPIYDLNTFLNKVKDQPSKWGDKYVFVK